LEEDNVRAVVVVICLACGLARAEEPVHFVDPALKAAVEDALWILDPTPTDMLGLTSFTADGIDIADLTGLEYATNLQHLVLRLNNLSDASPLSALTNLESLILHRNKISDISPLAGLTRLRTLNIDWNQISDISALSGLSGLVELNLCRNQVSDISPLLGLTSLAYLNLSENPLSDESYESTIPKIMEDNPGITVRHDRGPYSLTLSSNPGGSIVQPGEGRFIIGDGNPVVVEARPDPGFVFVGFTGAVSTTQNPLTLAMTVDCSITADFESVSDPLYVDGNAVGDLSEDGSQEHPFHTVQKAVSVAKKGASVFVRPGTYRENIDFRRRSICLRGFDPADPRPTAYPVLDGGGSGCVVTIAGGQDPNCVVEGFVLTRGKNDKAGAILSSDSSPTFVHCLIAGNRSSSTDGAAVRCTNSRARFVNCTFADNYSGQNGIGLRVINSNVTLVNSILWGNGRLQALRGDLSTLSTNYCDIQDRWLLAADGIGDMDCDPLFAQRGSWVDPSNPAEGVEPDAPSALWAMGDYHVRSQAGRWDALAGLWALDAVTSPCVDAGDPGAPVGQEPFPNGSRVNLGAYGGTPQASESVSAAP
jgi:hypothetical protein